MTNRNRWVGELALIAALTALSGAACTEGPIGVAGGVPGSGQAPLNTSIAAPDIIDPSGKTDAQPKINWTTVDNAEYYNAWINDSSGRLAELITIPKDQCGADSCTVVPSVHLTAGVNTVWVNGGTADGGEGPWSKARQWNVVGSTVPGPIAPSGAVTDTLSPDYVWTATGADQYELWVSNAGTSPRVHMFVDARDAGCARGEETCSFRPDSELKPGTSMFWLRGSEGGWSSGLAFIVTEGDPPKVAENLLPSGDTLPIGEVTFTWTRPDSGVTELELWLKFPDGFEGTDVFKPFDAECDERTECSMVYDLTTEGNYEWWMRTIGPGGMSEWSTAASFTLTP